MVADETIGRAVMKLVDVFKPERVVLFGSQARGTADGKSDVDILMICALHGRRRDLMVQANRALRSFMIPFDVIFLTPDEFERDRVIPGTIARPAWLEGKVVYERAP
jgi:predicted nucleotidyltransferase